MMVMEGIIAISCLYGNNDACQNGIQAYAKYNKLDTQIQVIGDNIKRKYPSVYMVGIIGGSLSQKKYKTMIYKGFGGEVDFNNPSNETFQLFYKYSY